MNNVQLHRAVPLKVQIFDDIESGGAFNDAIEQFLAEEE